MDLTGTYLFSLASIVRTRTGGLIGLARLRCHAFTEDMRRFVCTPERGALNREGEEFGLRDVGSLTSYNHEARQAIGNASRRHLHLPWVGAAVGSLHG